jgi:hypothetical protein
MRRSSVTSGNEVEHMSERDSPLSEPESESQSDKHHRVMSGCGFNLGLVLEGEDAQRFDEYLRNPTCTPEGMELIKAVMEHHKACEKTSWCLACGHHYEYRDVHLNTSKCRLCGKDAVVWGTKPAYAYYQAKYRQTSQR